MKKYMIVLILAVLMLASAMTVGGKHQSANVQSEIDGGHHNTIVTNVNQVSQVINGGGNIPYGQLKKVAGVGKNGQIADGSINQYADINSQIIGGHHNTIITNSNQSASIAGGAQTPVNNSTASSNISQTLNADSTIAGGHHNVILVGSIQSAYVNASATGNISQTANINNLIDGGHHNMILVGSSQTAQLGGMTG